jgi:hypothetical protein
MRWPARWALSPTLPCRLPQIIRLGGRRRSFPLCPVTAARLDLSLALIAAERHDEAAGTALQAVTSGRLAPSNYWRAREVIDAIAGQGLPEARELNDA